MSRKKKTLKQKKLSDLRKHSSAPDIVTQNVSPTFTYTPEPSTKPATSPHPKQSPSIRIHQTADLKKSMVISVILVMINTAIYLLYANNIIPLSILGLE